MVKNKKTIQFIGVDCILMVILTLLDQWTEKSGCASPERSE